MSPGREPVGTGLDDLADGDDPVHRRLERERGEVARRPLLAEPQPERGVDGGPRVAHEHLTGARRRRTSTSTTRKSDRPHLAARIRDQLDLAAGHARRSGSTSRPIRLLFALVEVDADAPRADVDAGDAEVDDLAEPFGAVLRGAGDRETVDQLVRAGLARVEVDLARSPALDARDAAAGRPVDRLHRLHRLPVLAVLGGARHPAVAVASKPENRACVTTRPRIASRALVSPSSVTATCT